MSNEFVRNGQTFRKGDVVKLIYDDEFSSWNKNITGRHGVIVDVRSYYISCASCADVDTLVDVLVDKKIITFEWEDLELI